MTTLRVNEIFESISGEVGLFPQGSPTTFIRLQGCNLQCPDCDTKYALNPKGGTELPLADVFSEVCLFPWNQILITGGEPLTQPEGLQELVGLLKGAGKLVQVETNGSLDISNIRDVDCMVVDCKGEDSMGGTPYWFDPGVLNEKTWVKYLVGSWNDVYSAIGMAAVLYKSGVKTHSPKFAISPLAEWAAGKKAEIIQAILQSKLPITFNTQLHKWIGMR